LELLNNRWIPGAEGFGLKNAFVKPKDRENGATIKISIIG